MKHLKKKVWKKKLKKKKFVDCKYVFACHSYRMTTLISILIIKLSMCKYNVFYFCYWCSSLNDNWIRIPIRGAIWISVGFIICAVNSAGQLWCCESSHSCLSPRNWGMISYAVVVDVNPYSSKSLCIDFNLTIYIMIFDPLIWFITLNLTFYIWYLIWQFKCRLC